MTTAPSPSTVLIGVAALVLFAMAALHLMFYPGLIFRRKLPRVASYVFGLATIITGFALYQGVYLGDWQAVGVLIVMVAAAAIPTLGLRILARYAHLERVAKELNGGSN